MIIGRLIGGEEMENVLENSLLDSPLFEFIGRNWRRWEKGIGAVDLQERDLMLYLMWGLDLVKDRNEDTCQEFSETVYSAVRRKFTRCGYPPNPAGVAYVSNLVCASVLHCCSLILSESLAYMHVYEELLMGFNKYGCREEVESLRGDFVGDEVLLKEWMVSYMNSEKFYTTSEEIEWEKGTGCEPLIKRGKIAKIDLFRVIIALHEIGAFKSVDGSELHQKNVIQAFGQMLGEDYSGYTNNVSGGTSTENPEIFDKLKKAFVKYEKKKLKEKEARG